MEKQRVQDAGSGMFDDPELPDENDPAYKLELFETLRAIGHKPERVQNDPVFAKEYAEWLKDHPG